MARGVWGGIQLCRASYLGHSGRPNDDDGFCKQQHEWEIEVAESRVPGLQHKSDKNMCDGGNDDYWV